MAEKEYTIDEVIKDFDTVKADTGLEKDSHAKNITISDWNDLVKLCAKTIPNVENILKFLKSFSDSVSEDFENTSDAIKNLEEALSEFSAYATQTFSKKLDKVTTTGQRRAYIIQSDGTQGIVEVRPDAADWSIPMRQDGGRLEVGAPKGNGDAVRKQDLDTKVTKFADNVHNMPVAYYQYGGNVLPMVISNVADENTLARRAPGGMLRGADAKDDTDLVNKRYFEANKISKVEFNAKDISSHVYTLALKDSKGLVAETEVNLPLESIKIAEIDDKVRDDGTRMLTVRFADDTSVDFELDEIFSGLNELVGDKVDTATFNEKVAELEDELGTKSRIVSRVYDEDSGEAIEEFIEELDINALATKANVEAVNNTVSEVATNVRDLGGEVNGKCIGKQELATVMRNIGSGRVFATTDDYSDYRHYVVAGGSTAYSLALRQENGVLNVGAPTNLNHATPKHYVDNAITGATLEFTESTQTGFEHNIPGGVASNAILNSVEGANERDENNNVLKVGALETVDSLDTYGASFSTFVIPSALRSACGASYGMQWTKLDFDKKRFEDSGVTFVLDGTTYKASYTANAFGNTYFSISLPKDKYAKKGNANAFTFVSSHFVPTGKYIVDGDVITQPAGYLYYSGSDWQTSETNDRDCLILFSGNLGLNTVEDFNAWLKKQYDNGTPVTFRYQSDTEPVVVDLSSHLTDYKRFKTIPIVENCGVQFNCDDFVLVTSTITYLRRKS